MRRVAIVIVVAAAAMQAFADSGTADRAVEEAKARAANNDFVAAAAKYREAYKADPRPELMCNVGVAYYKAQDLPKAQRYLDQCLSIGSSLDRAFIASVKKVLAGVESRLAGGSFTPVDLLVEPSTATTSVERDAVFDEPILGSHRVWFPFGRYRLTVHAEGHVDRVIEVAAKDRTQIPVRVALERAPTPAPVDTGATNGSGTTEGSAAPHDQGSAAGPAHEPHAPTTSVETRPRSVLPPVLATGASVALGGVALGYFLAARDSASKAGDATERPDYDHFAEQARSRQHMSWLFGGAAAAGAAVSAVLWYRYANPPRIEVQASGSGGGVAISGRW